MDVHLDAAGEKGRGVFATRDFVRGETVIVGKAIASLNKRTRMSVQLDGEHHVEMDAPATFLNHSCEPNLGVRGNAWSAYDFVAVRDVVAGEELTFDYAMTEYELTMPMECRCESSGCDGTIRPWRERDEAWRERYAPYVAAYLASAARIGGAGQPQVTA